MTGNYDAIITLLEALKLANIKSNPSRHEIRCSREEGRNPTSVWIDTNSLFYNCFSTGKRGSIHSLVMDKLGVSFPEALRWVTNTLKLDVNQFNQRIKLPFGGFYKNVIKESEEPELYLPTYDESILQPYSLNGCNQMFADDGISCKTQRKFMIGYDADTMRITIPQWNINGELIGIMGRLNTPNCEYGSRWLPIIPCSRSLTLYGYHMNYSNIQQKQTCLIFESEKSVMQTDSMGVHVGLATCTNTISDTQAKYLKALRIENIIIGYDEGVDEEIIRHSAEKLIVKNSLYKNKVGYIYDGNNEIIPKGSKSSPSDMGFDGLKELMRSKIKWVTI